MTAVKRLAWAGAVALALSCSWATSPAGADVIPPGSLAGQPTFAADVGAAAVPSPMSLQPQGPATTGGNGQNNLPQNGTSLVAYGIGELPTAAARVAVSRMMLWRAEGAIDTAFRDARHTFENSTGYKNAQADEKNAQDAYKAAEARALNPLFSDPTYNAMVALRDRLGDRIADRRDQPNVTPASLVPAASEKLHYQQIISAMEGEALANDPSVAGAREKFIASAAKFTQLKAAFEETLRTDPTIRSAEADQANANVALVAAEAYFAGVKQVRDDSLNYSYALTGYNPNGYGNSGGYDGYGYGCPWGFSSIAPFGTGAFYGGVSFGEGVRGGYQHGSGPRSFPQTTSTLGAGFSGAGTRGSSPR